MPSSAQVQAERKLTIVATVMVLIVVALALTLFVTNYNEKHRAAVITREHTKIDALKVQVTSYIQRNSALIHKTQQQIIQNTTAAAKTATGPVASTDATLEAMEAVLESVLANSPELSELHIWRSGLNVPDIVVDRATAGSSGAPVQPDLNDLISKQISDYAEDPAQILHWSPFFTQSSDSGTKGASEVTLLALIRIPAASVNPDSGSEPDYWLVAVLNATQIFGDMWGLLSDASVSTSYILGPDGSLLVGDLTQGQGDTDSTGMDASINFVASYPQVWTRILANPEGVDISEHGAFISALIGPETSSAHPAENSPILTKALVVMNIPPEALYRDSFTRSFIFWLFSAALFAWALAVGWFFWREIDLRARLRGASMRHKAALEVLEHATETGGIGLLTGYPINKRLQMNSVARRLYDLPEDEYPEITFPQLLDDRVDPDYRKLLRNAVERTLSERSQTELIYPIQHRSYGRIWLRATLEITDQSLQENEHVVRGSIVDVTQLMESKLQLKAALDAIDDLTRQGHIGLHTLDLHSQEFTGNVVFRELFDLPASEFETIKFEEFRTRIEHEQRPAFDKLLATLVTTGEPQSLVLHVKKRSLTEHWVKVNFEVTVESTELLRGSCVDVTDMVVAQRELARQQRDQNRVFGIIAHELRTPAAAIEMLNEELELPEAQKLDLRDMSRQLLSVIDDLRVAINPQESVEINPVNFTLENLFNQIDKSVKPLFQHSPIKYTKRLGVTDEQLYYSDAYRIRAIVTNLIKNAILHSEGNNVYLSVRKTAHKVGGDQLTITVEDDGKGIASDQVHRLFEAFERGDTNADGTGVGLYIVKAWASLLDGTVRYSPSSLGGACFNFELRLPYADDAEHINSSNAKSTLELAQKYLKGKTVLLVEDDALIRRLSANMLKKTFDIELKQSADGAEALLMQRRLPVDLIITDYFMPEMDGREMTVKLREWGDNTPIIGVTAASIGHEREQLLTAGMNKVLIKPMDIEQLTAAIVEYYDS